MVVLAYIISLLVITFWALVVISVKISWIKEDRQAKAEREKPKKTSIYFDR